MIAKQKGKTIQSRLPKFDPTPSGVFAYHILQAAHVEGALIGRLAVWSWIPDASKQSFTKDLDIAVSTSSLPAIIQQLHKKQANISQLPIGGINAKIEEKSINVDFIDRSDSSWGDLSALFTEAIDEAMSAERYTSVGEVELRLVSAEFLATMKLATGTSKDEIDAENLIQFAEIDISKTRTLVVKYLGSAGIGRLEELLFKLGHPESRVRKYKLS
jgi:hypothetical protein